MNRTVLSLSELNALVKDAVEYTLPDTYWVRAEVASVRDGPPYLLQAVGAADVELVFEVQVARGDEGVYARFRRAGESLCGSVDVLLERA